MPRDLKERSTTGRALAMGLGVAALGLTVAASASCTQSDPAPAPPRAPASASDRAASDVTDAVDLSAPIPGVRLEKVFTTDSWTRPTQIVACPTDGDLLVVIEQGGRVRMVRPSAPRAPATLLVDLTDRVSFGSNEEGMLSLCFHPRFAENGEFFVYYSAAKPRRSVLSRLKATRNAEGTLIADREGEQVILTVPQPYWNHNGGTVLFGPDGMLYLSIGDGGSAGDPRNFGQDLSSLLGKVVRIDVDRPAPGSMYAIPTDNPLVGRDGARPEIFAWGLRNVWRMSFDRTTGFLWGGDVGQNAWEEINIIVSGGNYGWRLREGRRAFARGGEQRGSMIDPVIEYPRRDGLSVTGGHVYRGERFPEWHGVYIYADYANGTIWGVRTEGQQIGPVRRLARRGGLHIASFGETLDGELFLCGFEGSERGPGGLYRLVRAGAGS